MTACTTVWGRVYPNGKWGHGVKWEPLVRFAQAIRTRKPAGGNADVSHRASTVFHLANIALRLGRKLQWDRWFYDDRW